MNFDFFLLPLPLLVLPRRLVGAGGEVGHTPALPHLPPVLTAPPISAAWGPIGTGIASKSGEGAGLRGQSEVGRGQRCEEQVLPGESSLPRVVWVRVELLVAVRFPAATWPVIWPIEGLSSSDWLEEGRGRGMDSRVRVCPPPLPFLPRSSLPHSLVAVQRSGFACPASLHLFHTSPVIFPCPQSGLARSSSAWCFILWREVRLTSA